MTAMHQCLCTEPRVPLVAPCSHAGRCLSSSRTRGCRPSSLSGQTLWRQCGSWVSSTALLHWLCQACITACGAARGRAGNGRNGRGPAQLSRTPTCCLSAGRLCSSPQVCGRMPPACQTLMRLRCAAMHCLPCCSLPLHTLASEPPHRPRASQPARPAPSCSAFLRRTWAAGLWLRCAVPCHLTTFSPSSPPPCWSARWGQRAATQPPLPASARGPPAGCLLHRLAWACAPAARFRASAACTHPARSLSSSALQIVVFCPNAGLLSGIVLSLIPLLLPFHWQCLLLPVLPAAEGRLELMEVWGSGSPARCDCCACCVRGNRCGCPGAEPHRSPEPPPPPPRQCAPPPRPAGPLRPAGARALCAGGAL